MSYYISPNEFKISKINFEFFFHKKENVKIVDLNKENMIELFGNFEDKI